VGFDTSLDQGSDLDAVATDLAREFSHRVKRSCDHM